MSPPTASAGSADLALLTGHEVPELLTSALTGEVGAGAGTGSELALTARVDRVQQRPGAGVSVGYEVTYPAADGGVAGSDYLVASTVGLAEGHPGVATLDDGDRRVHVWRHPNDPGLPSLAAACDARQVQDWWGRLLGAGEVLTGPVHLEILAYRPLRRAVLRASAGSRVIYLKVLTRRRHDGLVARHRMLAEHDAPAPTLLATPAPGVVILDQAPGAPLAQVLAGARREPEQLPDPRELVAALDALPTPATTLRPRPSWSERLGFHAASATTALPQESVRVEALTADLERLLAASDAGPVVATHGDFYEANIFIVDGRVSSLIDVDSLGPGYRVDDLACLLAHLSVLPDLAPAVYPHVGAVVADWLRLLEADVDPVALRARAAAVALSLVSGADHHQGLARLAVAEQWGAEAETALMSLTGSRSGSAESNRTAPQPAPGGRSQA